MTTLDLSPLVEMQETTEDKQLTQQLIVKLSDHASKDEIEALKAQLGAVTVGTTKLFGFELWEFEQPVDPQDASLLKAIAIEGIEFAQPNYTLSVKSTLKSTSTDVSTSRDPGFDSLWGLENNGQTGGRADADIDAPEAWSLSKGTDVVVAVIDTGVDYTHPDLASNMWVNAGEIPGNGLDDDQNGFIDDYHGYDFANNDGDPFDDEGHGTHVAGTIAAVGDNGQGIVGVAPEAKIMALKFLDANGSGSTFAAIQAIEYATMMGAQISNNSWGGGGYSEALKQAIAAAGQAGQLVVAAAGNNYGNDNDVSPNYPSNYNLDNVISVASTDASDQFSTFSNLGQRTVDLAAPGSSILSTLPGGTYGTFSGTSMATPHVSGVAALLLAQDPDLTPTELKQKILNSVDPIPSLSRITVTGGRLNAYNALTEGNFTASATDPLTGMAGVLTGVLTTSAAVAAASTALDAAFEGAHKGQIGYQDGDLDLIGMAIAQLIPTAHSLPQTLETLLEDSFKTAGLTPEAPLPELLAAVQSAASDFWSHRNHTLIQNEHFA